MSAPKEGGPFYEGVRGEEEQHEEEGIQSLEKGLSGLSD